MSDRPPRAAHGSAGHAPQIHVAASPSGIAVHLTGDLDEDASLLVASAVAAAAESIGPTQRIDVDLRDSEHLSPRGLHVLARSTAQAEARARRVRVRFGRKGPVGAMPADRT